MEQGGGWLAYLTYWGYGGGREGGTSSLSDLSGIGQEGGEELAYLTATSPRSTTDYLVVSDKLYLSWSVYLGLWSIALCWHPKMWGKHLL